MVVYRCHVVLQRKENNYIRKKKEPTDTSRNDNARKSERFLGHLSSGHTNS